MTSPFSRWSLAAASLVVLVAATPGDAAAVPVSYFFRGIGSGELGAQSFNDAAFEIEVKADTATVVSGGVFVDWNADIVTTVTIAGLGTATYGDGFGVFVNRQNQPAGGPQVGFGRFQGSDRLDVGNAAFLTYTLDLEIGPLPVTVTFLGQFPSGGDTTSGGGFLLRSVTDPSFEARLTELAPAAQFIAPADVVEPTTTAIFAAGLAALGFARRRTA